MEETTLEGFAIVETMGHRRTVGKVSQVDLLGSKALRVETLDDPPQVQLIFPSALYAVTPCTEEQAKLAARAMLSPLWILGAISWAPPKETPVLPPPMPQGCKSCGAAPGERCRPDCDIPF